MFTIWRSAFHPKSSIVEVTSLSRSVVVKYTTFSSFTPADANCFATSSVPAPGGPVTRTVNPRGRPLMSALSSAAIPVDTTFAISLLDLQSLVAHEVQHVPNLLRLVLLHREDYRVRLLRSEVVHEDVEELAQDLRVVVDREGVDRVEDHDVVAVLRLSDQELDLQHEVLEHRRAFDEDRVRVLLPGGHHDLRDRVHEVDVVERDLEDLELIDDRRGRDRRRHVDCVEALLRRERVEEGPDHVEVVVRLHPERDCRHLREAEELPADRCRNGHGLTRLPSGRSRPSGAGRGGRRPSGGRGRYSRVVELG